MKKKTYKCSEYTDDTMVVEMHQHGKKIDLTITEVDYLGNGTEATIVLDKTQVSNLIDQLQTFLKEKK